ncbi:ribose methyltransferase [Schizosaccharomyces octosporus yFS286]|uniref:rRNA methyltransferase 1, mitochondrial n=1 Tax=Schizosaccharomyces octosporus (strain yFS286) TaxID=483514 RepID=S9RB60_SCHOY|nr:ribose methyltransferase [Schizosaccharomyces octosporus yFS286]EPX71374.1 ribose methyltransferase [Schizosaccharomyces octosporus yFS286]
MILGMSMFIWRTHPFTKILKHPSFRLHPHVFFLRSKSTFQRPSVHDYLYGDHPVRNALQAGKRSFECLFAQSSKQLNEYQTLLNLLKLNIPCRLTGKHELNELTNSRPHNGIVLKASPLEPPVISEIDHVAQGHLSPSTKGDVSSSEGTSKTSPPLYIYCDGISDPQNLGAIIRSSYFLGVHGILLSKKHNSVLSPVVSKASAGALELMNIYRIQNPIQFLKDCSLKDWKVFATAPMGSMSNENQTSLLTMPESLAVKPKIVVFGGEHGLRTNMIRQCEYILTLPHGDRFVDSLNVSVAAGIILHSMKDYSLKITSNSQSKL